MLVKCPDCSRPVSPHAPVCPQCGRPMRPVVTEQTGKGYKAAIIVGVLMLFLGVPISCTGAATNSGVGTGIGGIMTACGAVLIITGAIGGWWDHG